VLTRETHTHMRAMMAMATARRSVGASAAATLILALALSPAVRPSPARAPRCSSCATKSVDLPDSRVQPRSVDGEKSAMSGSGGQGGQASTVLYVPYSWEGPSVATLLPNPLSQMTALAPSPPQHLTSTGWASRGSSVQGPRFRVEAGSYSRLIDFVY